MRPSTRWWPVRLRLHQISESALASATVAAAVPLATSGAVEFDTTERPALVQLAVAFALSGYRVETDLEIVNLQRDACLLVGHHRELLAHFPDQSSLTRFAQGMAESGFSRDLDQ